MKKVFQRSRLNHFFLLFLIFFDFLLFKISYSLFESNNFFFAIIVFIAFFLSIRATINSFLTIERKIIISNEAIRISQLFRSKSYRWNEIREFGRFKHQTNLLGRILGKEDYWTYFIKSAGFGDKKIHLEDEKFSEIDEIITTMFQRAKNAKFVTITNTSNIPFKKKLEKSSWNKKET